MTRQREKFLVFKALHEQDEAFIIPNPWDVGSARLFEAQGFQALATTSSGFAYTLGRVDGEVSLEEKLAHCRALAQATTIPISADLENGFADDPEGVARTLSLASETGIVGGSIEDYSGEAIYDFQLAVERIEAAVETIRSRGLPFTLTARAENLLHGVNDLDDTIRRLQAFETAGADVLYAPGLNSLEQVRLVASALSTPINVLVTMLPGVRLEALSAAGATRLSIGGAMAQVAYGELLEGGMEMLNQGSFGWLSKRSAGGTINTLLNTSPG